MEATSGKLFTCSICGQMVSKRASVQIADKTRVCRTHDEANAALQQKQDLEVLRRETDPEKIRPPNGGLSIERPKFVKELATWTQIGAIRPITATQQCDLWDHCWVCGKPGINRDDIPVLMLVATEKLKDTDAISLLDPRKRMEAAGLLGKDIIVRCSTIDMMRNLPIALEYARELHVKGRVVSLCKECAERHGMKPMWEDAIKAIFGIGRPQPTVQLAAVLNDAYMKSDLYQKIREFVHAEN